MTCGSLYLPCLWYHQCLEFLRDFSYRTLELNTCSGSGNLMMSDEGQVYEKATDSPQAVAEISAESARSQVPINDDSLAPRVTKLHACWWPHNALFDFISEAPGAEGTFNKCCVHKWTSEQRHVNGNGWTPDVPSFLRFHTVYWAKKCGRLGLHCRNAAATGHLWQIWLVWINMCYKYK